MKAHIRLLAVTVASIAFTMVSCSTVQKSKNPLVGTWKEIDGPRELRFSSGGTVRITDGSKTSIGRYIPPSDLHPTEAPWSIGSLEIQLATPVLPVRPNQTAHGMNFTIGISPDYLNLNPGPNTSSLGSFTRYKRVK